MGITTTRIIKKRKLIVTLNSDSKIINNSLKDMAF